MAVDSRLGSHAHADHQTEQSPCPDVPYWFCGCRFRLLHAFGFGKNNDHDAAEYDRDAEDPQHGHVTLRGMKPAECIDQCSHDDLTKCWQDRGLHAAQPRHQKDVSGHKQHRKRTAHHDPRRRSKHIPHRDRKSPFPDGRDDEKRSKTDHEIEHGGEER